MSKKELPKEVTIKVTINPSLLDEIREMYSDQYKKMSEREIIKIVVDDILCRFDGLSEDLFDGY